MKKLFLLLLFSVSINAASITSEPSNDTVYVGEYGSFTVAVTAQDSIRWQDSSSAHNWAGITEPDGDSTTYTTSMRSLRHNGTKFRCVAYGAGNDTSAIVALTVRNYNARRFINRYDSLDRGVLCIGFDDQFIGVDTCALPILDSLGLKCQLNYDGQDFTASGFTDYEQMTDSMLLVAQDSGHYVAAHAWTIVDPDLQVPSFIRNDNYKLFGYMWQRGLNNPEVLSWPYGHNSKRSAVSGLYDFTSRTVNTAFTPLYDSVPFTDSLKDVMPLNSTDTSTIFAAIDSAISGKKKLLLRFHSVGDQLMAYNLNYTRAQFRAVASYAKRKQDNDSLYVRPFAETLKRIPTIAGLSHPTDSSTTIKIYGDGFYDSAATVYIDTVSCTINSQKDDSITITIPNISNGTYDLYVKNLDNLVDASTVIIANSKQVPVSILGGTDTAKAVTVDRSKILSNIGNFPLWIDLSKDSALWAYGKSDSSFAVSSVGYTGAVQTTKWAESIDTTNHYGSLFINVNLSRDSSSQFILQSGNSLDVNNNDSVFTLGNCTMRLGLEETAGAPIDATGNLTFTDALSGENRDTVGAFGNSNAWRFNGGYLQASGPGSFDDATALTIEFMVRPTNTATIQQVVSMYKSDSYFFNLNMGGVANALWIASGDAAQNATVFQMRTDTTKIPFGLRWLNNWHHIAVVYNGVADSDTGKIKIYIDGTNCAIVAVAGVHPHLADFTGYGFKIGNGNANLNLINGALDEINIYSDAKSEDWVISRYAQFLGGGLCLSYDSYAATNQTGLIQKIMNYIFRRRR